TADFGQNRESVRIPFNQCGSNLYMIAFIDLELCAVHDGVTFFLTTFLIHDCQHTVPVHRNEETFLVPDGLEAVELDRAGILRFQTRLPGDAACRTTDVERTHGQLRSRLTNGLRRDDTDRLADLDEFSGGKISTVAADASTAARFAGQ